MNILLALLPVSLALLAVAILAFLWAVRRGQFDDLDTPPLDILGDDDAPRPKPLPAVTSGDDAAAGDAPTAALRDDLDAPPDGSGGAADGGGGD